MGCKNNRGRVEAPRAATVYSENKALAEKQRVENLKLEKEKAEQLIQVIHQHDSMAIEQVGDTKQLIIDLDFVTQDTLPICHHFSRHCLCMLHSSLILRSDSTRPHDTNHALFTKIESQI